MCVFRATRLIGGLNAMASPVHRVLRMRDCIDDEFACEAARELLNN
jgi:hypothetical protein